jgi:hypothetical protein
LAKFRLLLFHTHILLILIFSLVLHWFTTKIVNVE